jgi:LPS export ABC transporter protein LptC/lipopolysaccharide transport protein LptA
VSVRFFVLLRIFSLLLLFLTICLLWPRELDGISLGRDGRVDVPDYAMTNAHYISVRGGKLELEAYSKDASYDLEQRRMDARNVTAYLFNERNEKTQLKADSAYFLQEARWAHFQDHVESLSPDGFQMKGSEADYYMKDREIKASQPVEGESKDGAVKVWGDTAKSFIDQHTVDLAGNARSAFKDKKRGLTKVRGDKARLDRGSQQVTFTDHVVVEQGTTTATSRQANLFYNDQDRTVRYMSLLDDVKITEKDGKHTRSQVAEFFAPTDTIVLSGFPAVYHGDDVVTGDKITLYRTTGVVEVTATNAVGSPEERSKRKEPAKPQTLSPEDEELIP